MKRNNVLNQIFKIAHENYNFLSQQTNPCFKSLRFCVQYLSFIASKLSWKEKTEILDKNANLYS